MKDPFGKIEEVKLPKNLIKSDLTINLPPEQFSARSYYGFPIGLCAPTGKEKVDLALPLLEVRGKTKGINDLGVAIEADPVFESILEELPDGEFSVEELRDVVEEVVETLYEGKAAVTPLVDDLELLSIAIDCWKANSFMPAYEAGRVEDVALKIFRLQRHTVKDILKSCESGTE